MCHPLSISSLAKSRLLLWTDWLLFANYSHLANGRWWGEPLHLTEDGDFLRKRVKIDIAMKEYKISTFAELMQALRENPEWLRQLRRMILTQELLRLPSEFGRFRRRADERFDAIEKEFEDFRHRVEERFDTLEKQLQGLKEEEDGVKQKLERDVGVLKGIYLEMKVKENVLSFFSEHLLSARVIDQEEANKALSLAMENGIISKEEREDVLRLDLIVEGTLLSTKEPVLVAVEVSYTISEHDVQRAVRRAEILKKVMGRKVLPAVVGCRIAEGTEKLITKTGCLRVLALE